MINEALRWYQRLDRPSSGLDLAIWYYALQCDGFEVHVSGACHDRPTEGIR